MWKTLSRKSLSEHFLVLTYLSRRGSADNFGKARLDLPHVLPLAKRQMNESKRINQMSPDKLRSWLTTKAAPANEVMLVAGKSHATFQLDLCKLARRQSSSPIASSLAEKRRCKDLLSQVYPTLAEQHRLQQRNVAHMWQCLTWAQAKPFEATKHDMLIWRSAPVGSVKAM